MLQWDFIRWTIIHAWFIPPDAGRIDEPEVKKRNARKVTVLSVFSVRPAAAKVRACLITGIDLDDAALSKLAADHRKTLRLRWGR